MQQCAICGSYDFIIENDVCTGWQLVADKVTCLDCVNVEYFNEHQEN